MRLTEAAQKGLTQTGAPAPIVMTAARSLIRLLLEVRVQQADPPAD
jgi:hypothetical protein